MKFTFNDYLEAKKWLIDINEYDNFMNNSFSVDGYSLISYANEKYEELNISKCNYNNLDY